MSDLRSNWLSVFCASVVYLAVALFVALFGRGLVVWSLGRKGAKGKRAGRNRRDGGDSHAV